jgi:hypothetical protein
MTTVFPLGGAELSDCVWMIFVGVAWYCCSFWSAVVAPPPEPELDEPVVAVVAEVVGELDDPHAASAAAVASVTRSAASGRTP